MHDIHLGESQIRGNNQPHVQSLSSTTEKILDILNLPEKIKNRQELIAHFQHFSKLLNETSNPDYNYEDYAKRILQNVDKKRETFFQIIKTHPELQNMWQEIGLRLQGILPKEIVIDRMITLHENTICENINEGEEPGDAYFLGKENITQFLAGSPNLNLSQKAIEIGWECISEMAPNGLKILSEKLASFPVISMSCNSLGKLEIDQIRDLFSCLSEVKHLDLSVNILYYLSPAGCKILGKALSQTQSINLSNNQCDKYSSEGLQAIFENFNALKYLDLSNNSIGEISGDFLENIFSPLSSLRFLNLTNNQLGTISPKSLRIISTPLKALHTLNLARNQVTEMKESRIKAFFTPLIHISEIYFYEEVQEYEKEAFLKRLSNIVPDFKAKIEWMI